MKKYFVLIGSGMLVVLIALGAAVLLSSDVQPQSSDPAIVWSPDHLELTLGPRESKTVSVTLTANRSLPAVSAQVSFSIARWVTITPSSYPSTPAGTQRTFTLSFAIGPDPDLGTINAALQLVRANGTGSPQEGTRSRLKLSNGDPMETNFELMDFPLPIMLNIWPSFTDATVGFEVKYPPTFAYREIAPNQIGFFPVHSQPDPSSEYVGDIVLEAIPNTSGADLGTYYHTIAEVDLYANSASATLLQINGVPAVKFTNIAGMVPTDVIAIDKGDVVIELSDVGQLHSSDGILDMMASSVR